MLNSVEVRTCESRLGWEIVITSFVQQFSTATMSDLSISLDILIHHVQ